MLFNQNVIDLLKKTIAMEYFIDLRAKGDSMFPFIQQDEVCRFTVCEPSLLKKGDIVLFWAKSGQLVVHRLYQMEMMDGESLYVFKGDTNLGFDEPVGADRIIGQLEYVQKKERTVKVIDSYTYLWGKLILSFPILSGLLRTYLNRKRKFNH